MPSTPIRPLSNHLVINTHNLSQAHNRGSPRSANANSALSFKDPLRPPVEKRHSYGPSSLGLNSAAHAHSAGGNGLFSGHSHLGHGHGPARSRQSLALNLLRTLAVVPGFVGLMYSLSTAWDDDFLEQYRRVNRDNAFQDEIPLLTKSDFWVASMWCGLSIYWAFLLTTAIIQRLLQSYRPPNVVLRVALAHVLSWIVITVIITSRPVSEPTWPWVLITLGQGLMLLIVVYLPRFKSQINAAGFPKLSEQLAHHALDDGFMGREINGQSATRFLVMPIILVALCSWMLIITRGHTTYLDNSGQQGSIIQESSNPSLNAPLSGVLSGSLVNGNNNNNINTYTNTNTNNNNNNNINNVNNVNGGRQQDTRMVISMIVLSSATQQGYLNRQMFRDTTLKLFPSPRNKAVVVKYRFIIGSSGPGVERQLEEEHKVKGDLLIVYASDRPDSKSQKLYKAIEWANQFDFDYLVKTEDDVLVRMDTLSGELYKQGRKSYFWKGLVFKNVPNTRLDDLDLKEMPAFTDDTLITLSRDIVRLLSVPAPRYNLASSAQSLGIWLHGYGIKPLHDTRIQPGAFVCEEDLIAKHFDSEPSLLRLPRDDPVKMVERINIIRAELKANKNNRNFRTQVSICDPLIQKRCAICYSCQGRASNWKLMGFDCKQGGVVVGDKYRKPELLDSKQMDELLNRPSTGVSEELGPITLKDYRPESRARQMLQSSSLSSTNQDGRPPSAKIQLGSEDEVQQGLAQEDEENENQSEEEEEDEEGVVEYDEPEESQKEQTKDGSVKDAPSEGQDEELLEAQDEEEALDEEAEELEREKEEEETDSEHHDESEMSISDLEVDYLDRRNDEDEAPLSALKPSKRSRRAGTSKKNRSK